MCVFSFSLCECASLLLPASPQWSESFGIKSSRRSAKMSEKVLAGISSRLAQYVPRTWRVAQTAQKWVLLSLFIYFILLRLVMLPSFIYWGGTTGRGGWRVVYSCGMWLELQKLTVIWPRWAPFAKLMDCSINKIHMHKSQLAPLCQEV